MPRRGDEPQKKPSPGASTLDFQLPELRDRPGLLFSPFPRPGGGGEQAQITPAAPQSRLGRA